MWVKLLAASHERMHRLTFACTLLALCHVPVEAQDAPLPPAALSTRPPAAAVATQPPPAAAGATTPQPNYGARAEVAHESKQPEEFGESETQRLQRVMGPAFWVAESLPGVVPVFSGVPYLIVRGATPAGSLSYYDGMEVPSLFHVALLPGIVDPNLSGAMSFYPGPAPARYGPRSGAVMDLSGPDPERLRVPMRELQVSLLDASGFLNVPTDDGSLSIAWSYGNPGIVLNALNFNATLNFYDYQLRYEKALTPHLHLVLSALGDGDQLGDRTAPQDDIDMSFHRVLARLIERTENFEFGAQLVLGADASILGHQLSGRALRADPSVYAQWQLDSARLRVGAEATSAMTALARNGTTPVPDSSDESRQTRITLDPEDFLDGEPFSAVPNRELLGAYAELRVQPGQHFQIDAGLRADVFIAGSHADPALSPSIVIRHHTLPWLELHAALALAHKPRTSPLPIPGLEDVALDAGVEGVVQSEAGATFLLTKDTELSGTLFYHRYLNTVYLELILDCQGNTDPQAAQELLTQGNAFSSICRRRGLPTADGESHGLELFFKRDLTKRFSGFVSYTLAFASATALDGTPFTPQSDVRHTVNAVLLYDFGAGFSAGLRIHYRTGKMAVNTIYDLASEQFARLEYRLPGFFRGDVYASYEFKVPFGKMALQVGLQNFTFSREATNRDCYALQSSVVCQVDYQPYIVLPNAGLWASF